MNGGVSSVGSVRGNCVNEAMKINIQSILNNSEHTEGRRGKLFEGIAGLGKLWSDAPVHIFDTLLPVQPEIK